MIAEGYGDPRTLERRARKMEEWLENPTLMRADKDAEYAAVIEIDLAEMTEPIVCAPNDPDDARLLSEVAGDKVDEVFIGSCMTNIGHFRAAGKLLEQPWARVHAHVDRPPTRMDEHLLMEEGYYSIYGQVRRPHRDARLLPVHGQPGARGPAHSTVLSTRRATSRIAWAMAPTSTSRLPSSPPSAPYSASCRRPRSTWSTRKTSTP
jgi:aconitate hydratase 2/2-methylisocitrate dehydratase